jgi:hypothetical protein
VPLIKAMRGEGKVFPVERVRDVEGKGSELRAHLKLAGIERPELHDGTKTLRPFDVRSFRTTFASLARDSGVDPWDIDKWLGHSQDDGGEVLREEDGSDSGRCLSAGSRGSM